MSYQINVAIPGLPKLPNELRYAHWRKVQRERDHWHTAVWGEFLSYGKKPMRPLGRARLELVRHSATEPDPDAITASFKNVIDGLVLCGVLAGDTSAHVKLDPAPTWKRAPARKGFVTIIIEEIA